ncbi:MAG: WD40/YVTN/BNR-like repeat-containing protein [Burkholderiales bacterium]
MTGSIFRGRLAALGLTAGLLGTVFLGGCAMSPAQRQALDPANTVVPDGQGLLVARVVSNLSPSPILFRATQLRVRAIPDGDTRYLSSKAAPTAGGAIFLEALPPGRYQLLELTMQVGNGSSSARLDRQVPYFEVQANRVTDLGALVIAFESAGIFSGKYRVGFLPSPTDTDSVLQHLPTSLRDRLSAIPPLRVVLAKDPEDNQQILSFARTFSSITSQSELSDGLPVAFGRTLGIVSDWNPGTQAWSHVDTGRSFNVRSVSIEPNGTRLLGLEEGVLLLDDGFSVTAIPPPLTGASILFVGRRRNGEIIAVVEDRNNYVVFSSPGLKPPAWTELKRFPVERMVNPYLDTTPQIALARDRLVIFIGVIGWTADTVVHSLDFATGAWESHPSAVSSIVITKFIVLYDGTIISAGGTAFTRALFRSTDWGKTWVRKPQENWSMQPIVRDNNVMYMWRLDGLALTESSSVSWLLKSENGGETWTLMGELPKYMSAIHILPKPGWLLLTTRAGSLYISNDDGKTWKPELVRFRQ